jgi:hypothetical protein
MQRERRLTEAATVGGIGDLPRRAFTAIERVGRTDGLVKGDRRLEVGSIRVDADDAGIVLQIERGRFAAVGDTGPAGLRPGGNVGMAFAVGMRRGDRPPPLFLDLPGVMDAFDARQVTGERRLALGGALQLGEADEDTLCFRGGKVIDDPLACQL